MTTLVDDILKHGTQVSIELAPFDSKDIHLARLWCNDYRIWKWRRQNDLISDWQQDKWFESQAQNSTIKIYKIMMKSETSTPIGVCGFTGIDLTNRHAEFSLYIAPGYWGNKLGRPALSVLLTHGFKNLGFHVIHGEVFDGNPALKLFIEVGFRIEGTRQDFYFRDGKFIDCHLISMKEDEWKL